MRRLATFRETAEQDQNEVRKLKKKVFESNKENVALTKTQLKKRPGWNDDRLEKFLGAPDFTTKNSYRRDMETSWFMMSRIKKAENYKSFQKDAAQALKQHSKRKKAAEKAVETKKRKTLNKVQERIDDIKLKKKYCNLSTQQLYIRAARSYDDYQLLKDNWEHVPVDINTSTTEFLNRITVNYLRHNCTTYDSELEQYFNTVGKQEAINMIRKHIYLLIVNHYPFLKDECVKQATDRGILLQV